MNENSTQEYMPKNLAKYLVYLWIALINVGVDFGLLLKANQSFGVVILIILFVVSILFSIYWTKELVNLFRENATGMMLEETPEII